MKTRNTNINLATPLKLLVLLVASGLVLAGCASADVNPAQSRANMGYVDFRAEPAADLCWQIERFDERSRDFRQIFWKAEPPPAGVLRLALAPGAYRLRVTLLDLGTSGPAEVQVEVVEGQITPVRVDLAEEGAAQVKTVETSVGGTVYGRYGRRTKISANAAAIYNIRAAGEPPVPYQLKEKMPYAR